MMKKIIIMMVLMLFVMPVVIAYGTGGNLGGGIIVEGFEPSVWQCGERVLLDDDVQPWRVSGSTCTAWTTASSSCNGSLAWPADRTCYLDTTCTLGAGTCCADNPGLLGCYSLPAVCTSYDRENLIERNQQYLFEGERYEVDVVVFDKNKIEDAVVDIVLDGDCQGSGVMQHTVTYCDDIPSTNTNWADNLVLNKFDSSLGDLVSAEIELNTEMVNTINIENQDASPITVTLNSNGAVSITPMDGPVVTSIISISEDFIANFGTNIFNISDADLEIYSATNLGMYVAVVGDTTFNLPASASATGTLSSSGNFNGGVSTQASAQACVTYTYETEEECYSDYFTLNCVEVDESDIDFSACNARIDEEEITVFDDSTMQGYRCFIDILDSEHMYGVFWMSVFAEGYSGEGEYDEISKWFMNPIISLGVDGLIEFEDVRPGTSSYSEPVVIENLAEGGVLLDMFITGKNWPSYDTAPLARCQNVDGNGDPTIVGDNVNYLPLGAFRYYAENGAYSTRDDKENDGGVGKPAGVNVYDTSIVRNVDSEGYVNIHKQLNDGFEENMFNEAEILQANPVTLSNGAIAYSANLLYPGSVGMSMIFRLDLPEPCYGEYEASSDGGFFIWAEAV